MKNGDISNKTAPIIAINFETIFSRKPTKLELAKELITGDRLKYRFNKEFEDLTLKLFRANYNIHIISLEKDISKLEDKLFHHYIYFNQIYQLDLPDLYKNCKKFYKCYIDETHTTELLDNKYSLEDFRRLF